MTQIQHKTLASSFLNARATVRQLRRDTKQKDAEIRRLKAQLAERPESEENLSINSSSLLLQSLHTSIAALAPLTDESSIDTSSSSHTNETAVETLLVQITQNLHRTLAEKLVHTTREAENMFGLNDGTMSKVWRSLLEEKRYLTFRNKYFLIESLANDLRAYQIDQLDDPYIGDLNHIEWGELTTPPQSVRELITQFLDELIWESNRVGTVISHTFMSACTEFPMILGFIIEIAHRINYLTNDNVIAFALMLNPDLKISNLSSIDDTLELFKNQTVIDYTNDNFKTIALTDNLKALGSNLLLAMFDQNLNEKAGGFFVESNTFFGHIESLNTQTSDLQDTYLNSLKSPHSIDSFMIKAAALFKSHYDVMRPELYIVFLTACEWAKAMTHHTTES